MVFVTIPISPTLAAGSSYISYITQDGNRPDHLYLNARLIIPGNISPDYLFVDAYEYTNGKKGAFRTSSYVMGGPGNDGQVSLLLWMGNNRSGRYYIEAGYIVGASTASPHINLCTFIYDYNNQSNTIAKVSTSSGAGGTAQGGGYYNLNSTVTLTGKANAGFSFDGWYEKGLKIAGAGDVYRFAATESKDIEARFRKTNETAEPISTILTPKEAENFLKFLTDAKWPADVKKKWPRYYQLLSNESYTDPRQELNDKISFLQFMYVMLQHQVDDAEQNINLAQTALMLYVENEMDDDSDALKTTLEVLGELADELADVPVTPTSFVESTYLLVNGLAGIYHTYKRNQFNYFSAYLKNRTAGLEKWQFDLVMSATAMQMVITNQAELNKYAEYAYQLERSLNSQYTTIISAQCPVIMDIYNDKGDLLASLGNGEVGSSYNEYGSFYVEEDESGEFVKTAKLFTNDYSVVIRGTDHGQMDLNVSEYLEDGTLIQHAYNDVPITDTTVIGMQSETGLAPGLQLTDETGAINGTIQPTATITVNQFHIGIQTSSGGTALGEGTYPENAMVRMYALPNEGYSFDGWYEDNVRISSSSTFEMRATGDMLLEARFKQDYFLINVPLSANKDFGTQNEGYNRFADHTVVVQATGSIPSADISIILAGKDADCFELSKDRINGLVAGSSDSFTVVPKTGLSAGAYYATVTVLGPDNSGVFNLAFSVNHAPTYTLVLSPSSDKSFGTETVGYSQIPAHSVTVANYGNNINGNVTVALSGSNANDFVLSKTELANLAPGASDSFTVIPKTGLAAGIYTATVTVAGTADSSSFEVWFTVTDVSTYTLVLSPSSDKSFGTQTVGYSQIPAHSVTVANYGNSTNSSVTVGLSGTNASDFILSKTELSNLAAGVSDSFTIVPKTGLGAGTYTAVVSVTGIADSQRFNVSFTVTPVQLYPLTILAGAGGVVSGSGNYAAGSVINIQATSNGSYSFDGWTTNNGGEFGDANAASTTFTMPSGATVVTANFSYIGDDVGSNSDQNNGQTDITISPSLTPSTSITDDRIIATLEASSTVTGNSASVNISSALLNAAIDMLTNVDKNETANKAMVVAITINNLPVNVDTASIIMPVAAIENLVSKTNGSLDIHAGVLGDMKFDKKALSTIVGADSETVIVSISKANAYGLSEAQLVAVGERPVFDLKIVVGNTVLSDFNGGQVTVSVPYTPKKNEDTNAIVIYYVDSEGQLELVPNCQYDVTTGTVAFTTGHFSLYMIGYNPITFADISEHWAQGSIEFAAARGLVAGVGNNLYQPDRAITRAEFMQMVQNVLRLPEAQSSPYADVRSEAWYNSTINACYEAKLFENLATGKEAFRPDQVITREEMAVILANVSKFKKGNATKEFDLSKSYADVASITKDYRELVWITVADGLMNSTATVAGLAVFDPKGSATRAQAAQIQKNLLEWMAK
jgi:hypothetical protein